MSVVHGVKIACACVIALAVGGCGGDSVVNPGNSPGNQPGNQPGDGAPASLAFIAGPTDAVAGIAIDPAVRVEVRDADGNRVDGAELAVTLTLADNPGGATLMGATTVTSADGVAVFDDISLEKAADGYTLSATASGLQGSTSETFAIATAAPVQLALLTQPGTAEGRVPFDPVEVAILDEFGNTATDATVEVSVALVSSPSGEALGGTTTVEGADGVARFDDLTLALAGDGFVLEATSDGLAPATSAQFGVRTTFVQVSAGDGHGCAITAAGFVYCWGSNGSGELGDGTSEDRTIPAPVSGDLRFTHVSAGIVHTCGVSPDDRAYCWGRNADGRLGDGTFEDRNTPTPVASGLRFDRISAGAHTCGVTVDDLAYCWGSNDTGKLGDGTTINRSAPTAVAGGLRFARVSAANLHTCGLTRDDRAYCWGSNGFSEIGDGTTITRLTPEPVDGDHEFTQLSARGTHTCAVTIDGAAYCWGSQSRSVLDATNTPTLVDGAPLFARVIAGRGHDCGLTPDDLAYCWGANLFGQLGDGTTEDRSTPTPVSTAVRFRQVRADRVQTCGIAVDDVAYCWGANSNGQIGDGTTEQRLTPTHIVQ